MYIVCLNASKNMHTLELGIFMLKMMPKSINIIFLAFILTTCSKILNTCILITLCLKVMCNKFKMCYM